MRVIINGDDLGYTMGINEGMVLASQKGILRSTTAVMNGAYINEGAEMMREHPEIGVGLHLNLTLGKPLTCCPSLTDPTTGLFYAGRTEVWKHNPDYVEIEREWNAQMEAFVDVFGRYPDHIDSHHSVHDATPQALEISMHLAQKSDIPMRRYNSFQYVPDMFGRTQPQELIAILEKYEGQDIEIMAHNAIVDLDLYRWSSYSFGRVRELDILCSDEVKQYVKDHDIEITNYSEVNR